MDPTCRHPARLIDCDTLQGGPNAEIAWRDQSDTAPKTGPIRIAYLSDLHTGFDRRAHTHYFFETSVGTASVISAQRGYLSSEDGAEDFVSRIVELDAIDGGRV